MTIITKQASSLVPTDTMQWGNSIYAETVQRLPKIEPFIQGFRLVYSNADGDGLGLIILQGAKSFVPVIVKEWRTLPIDIVVYKKGKDTKYSYLSERALLKLLISSSLGTPTGLPRQGVNNAYVNTFSPSGGYGARTTNPWMGQNTKAADFKDAICYLTENMPEGSDLLNNSAEKTAFAIEQLKTHDFWKGNPDLAECIEPSHKLDKVDSYCVVEKTATDTYQMYTEHSEEPQVISAQDLAYLFSSIEDPNERISKVAGFESNRVSVMGNLLNREGSYFVGNENTSMNTKIPRMKKPINEGIFMYNQIPTYINPKTYYLDGTPSQYAVAVRAGAYSVSRDFLGFRATNSTDSSNYTRDQLLYENINPKSGSSIVFYDVLEGTMSLPCKVLHSMGDLDVINKMKVRPLYGDAGPVTVEFYSGSKVCNPSSGLTLMPRSRTIMYELPDLQTSFEEPEEMKHYPKDLIRVQLGKGGSNLFSIKEDSQYLPNIVGAGKFISTLIRRYGFGDKQAMALLNDLVTEKSLVIHVPFNLQETKEDAVQNNSILPMREKEAIMAMFKVANHLAHLPDVSAHPQNLDSLFETAFSKLAAADPATGNTAEANPQQSGDGSGSTTKMNGTQPQQQNPTSNLMSFLSNISPVARDTQEIIDTLTYYAIGRFKSDEIVNVITELEDYLGDVENSLAQLLLLTQFGRVPGMEYSDSKVLLSDIDSYLSRILSSRVLLKDI